MIPVKFKDMPGDVPKQAKIDMLEGRVSKVDSRGSLKSLLRSIKAYRKMVFARTRAVLKERLRRELE